MPLVSPHLRSHQSVLLLLPLRGHHRAARPPRGVQGAILPERYTSVGCKPDGGGSMAGRGLVGPMRLHRACNRRDMQALQAAVDAGDSVNEVEAVRQSRLSAHDGPHRATNMGRGPRPRRRASLHERPRPAAPAARRLSLRRRSQAGNTPLHSCAYEGWVDGARFLLQKGAKVCARAESAPLVRNGSRCACRRVGGSLCCLVQCRHHHPVSHRQVNASNNAGETAITWAQARWRPLLRLRLRAGGACRRHQQDKPRMKTARAHQRWRTL